MSLQRRVLLLASTLIAIPAGHSLAQAADGAGGHPSSSAGSRQVSRISVSVQPRSIQAVREIEVIVRLTEPSLAERAARLADRCTGSIAQQCRRVWSLPKTGCWSVSKPRAGSSSHA
jgi:hypothetical protein